MNRQARHLKAVMPAIGGLILCALYAQPAHASCGDRPGTPNETEVYAISGTMLDFRWRNTTGKGMNPSGSIGLTDQPHTMFFDIYVRNAAGQPVGVDVGGGARQDGLVYGMRSQYIIGGLVPNTQYCVSTRARTGANRNGCVSQLASGTVCATTLAAGKSRQAPPFDPYRPSGTAPPPPPPLPTGPRRDTATCKVVANVRVEQCREPVTGEPSQYFVPMSLQGCGNNDDEALLDAAVKGEMCFNDGPGCCDYIAEYVPGPGAARLHEALRAPVIYPGVRPAVSQEIRDATIVQPVLPNVSDRVRIQETAPELDPR